MLQESIKKPSDKSKLALCWWRIESETRWVNETV